MSKRLSPLSTYVDKLNFEFLSKEKLIHLMHFNKSSLNNHFMSGLGASKQLCKRLEKGSWQSKSSVKWIFTYRNGFYRFPKSELNVSIDIVQPLKGLSSESVKEALSVLKTSKEFLNEVIKRGAIAD